MEDQNNSEESTKRIIDEDGHSHDHLAMLLSEHNINIDHIVLFSKD